MSRIGKKPIEIPSGVEATIKEGTIEVKGTLGARHFDFSEKLNVDIKDRSITVTPKNLEKETHWKDSAPINKELFDLKPN